MKKIIIILILILTTTVQAQDHCKAYTVKGTQCMRTVAKDGLCRQHYTMKTGKVMLGKPKIDLPEEWPEMSTNGLRPSYMIAWRDSATNTIHIGYSH